MSTEESRIDALRRRVEEEPNSRAFVLLAEEYRQLGRLDEALGVLEQGLEVRPDYLAARVALGRCQLQAHRLSDSIATLEHVVEVDSSQMVAYKLLVRAYCLVARRTEARDALDRYRTLNPRDPGIQKLASLIVDGAVPEDTLTLARLYLEQGHDSEAEDIYRRRLAEDPRDEEAAAGLEVIAARRHSVDSGDPAQAVLPPAKQASLESRIRGLRSIADRLAVLREARDAPQSGPAI